LIKHNWTQSVSLHLYHYNRDKEWKIRFIVHISFVIESQYQNINLDTRCVINSISSSLFTPPNNSHCQVFLWENRSLLTLWFCAKFWTSYTFAYLQCSVIMFLFQASPESILDDCFPKEIFCTSITIHLYFYIYIIYT